MSHGKGQIPRSAETEPVLIFCHCPKTAGTSLFRAIRNVIGARRSYLATRSRPELAALRPRGIRFIAGHVPYPHYQAQADSGVVRFVTMVRDPDQVMLSLFRHYQRRRHLSETASRFFETDLPAAGIAADTPQAISLFFERVAPSEPFLPDNPQIRFAVDKMSGPISRMDLDQARRNLAAMDAVGSATRLADSLLLMAIRFGWSGLRYGRYNAAHKPSPKIELPADVRALCDLDRELVDWAERHLANALADARAECIGAGRPLPTVSFRNAPAQRMSIGWLREWLATARMYTRDDWQWWIGTKAASLRNTVQRYVSDIRIARRIRQECRFLATLAVSRRVGLWPRLAAMAGVAYLFVPVDLIPDHIPILGHLDEAGFLISGLLLARLLMPEGLAPANAHPRRKIRPDC